MEREGFVIKAEGPNVTVRFQRISGCGENCAHCGACNGQYEDLELRTNMKLSAGDKVAVASSQNAVYFGLFCLFVLPVVLPLAVFIVFSVLIGQTAGWISAGAALVLCVVCVLLLNRSRSFLERTRPRIVRRISADK